MNDPCSVHLFCLKSFPSRHILPSLMEFVADPQPKYMLLITRVLQCICNCYYIDIGNNSKSSDFCVVGNVVYMSVVNNRNSS